eukprot:TRINITY_DN7281_c0_g1_i1.p1 TRINITY_DN7281_c0_g1~~TRINITY_DN7281_c0_g1_i1.p1  ORF type:complete len:350 (-),score=47.49 TRINITY_DN7281_c0_g1_i1:32-1081(-)
MKGILERQPTSSFFAYNVHNFKGLLSALSYGVISITITFFNKAVFVYGFNASNFLSLGQIIFSIFFLLVMKRMKILDFEDFNIGTARTLFSLSISFIAMLVSGLAALRYVNVPMFSALRRLTSFIVILIQYFVMKKTVSSGELLSVIFMVGGAIVASWGDLTFDIYGYALTTFNCIVTAFYLVLIAKKSNETGIGSFGLMYYNNIMSLPVVAIITLTLEWNELRTFDNWSSLGFQFCFLMSSVQAFLLNYSMFLCSTVNSPLTTSIAGQVKSIVQTVFGLFAFGGIEVTPFLGAGLSVSTLGGIWYGVVKYLEQVSKKTFPHNASDDDLEVGKAGDDATEEPKQRNQSS